MSSRFLQGDGYPILKRYNSSNTLQETVNLPYVRDDGSNSFVKQILDPYPEDKTRQYALLSGAEAEDAPIGSKLRIQIKYVSILASDLKAIFNCILAARANSGDYLKLKPRDDYDAVTNEYKVIYKGSFPLESGNMWRHNIQLDFSATDLLPTSFVFDTAPSVITRTTAGGTLYGDAFSADVINVTSTASFAASGTAYIKVGGVGVAFTYASKTSIKFEDCISVDENEYTFLSGAEIYLTNPDV